MRFAEGEELEETKQRLNEVVDALNKLSIHVVRDSLNFGFCKYPQDVCDIQCQDCKAEEMWGNKNLH